MALIQRPIARWLLAATTGVALTACGQQSAGTATGVHPSSTHPSSTTVPVTSSLENTSLENTVPENTAPPASPTDTGEATTGPAGSAGDVAARPPRCSAKVLRGKVEMDDSAAGNRYARLVVTNTGSSACTLYGYGGLQLMAPDGKPVPTRLLRVARPGPSLVRLAPGASAAKNLHWVVVPTGDEPIDRPCQPAADHASVIPPDETEPFVVRWQFGSVCDAGRIEGSAYYRR